MAGRRLPRSPTGPDRRTCASPSRPAAAAPGQPPGPPPHSRPPRSMVAAEVHRRGSARRSARVTAASMPLAEASRDHRKERGGRRVPDPPPLNSPPENTPCRILFLNPMRAFSCSISVVLRPSRSPTSAWHLPVMGRPSSPVPWGWALRGAWACVGAQSPTAARALPIIGGNEDWCHRRKTCKPACGSARVTRYPPAC